MKARGTMKTFELSTRIDRKTGAIIGKKVIGEVNRPDYLKVLAEVLHKNK
jgi:hypothetical protein